MANRKQRRKEKRKYIDDYEQSTKTVLITLGVVVGVVLLFYLLTVLINNSKRGLNTKEPTKEEVKIQYDEILASDTFKMNDDEYYVLFYDFDGPEAVYYNYLFSEYASKKDNHIYKVDLGNAFNKKYVSNETNIYANNINELKVKDATLIKISYGSNVSYVEGSSLIIAKELS